MESKDLLSRVALRCGDTHFQDFDINIYEDALKKANRLIAKKYGIPNKEIRFKTSDMIEDVSDSIILDITDMKSEYTVKVNGKLLSKTGFRRVDTDYNSYYLEMIDGVYQFDYRYFVNIETKFQKSLDDEIIIYYTALPEYDSELSDYFIPQKYIEEQINETAKTIAEYGLAKFTDEIKVAKYTRLFQMLSKPSDYDKFTTEDKGWGTLKMWSPI